VVIPGKTAPPRSGTTGIDGLFIVSVIILLLLTGMQAAIR
jgi:hypothetical protein